ncbi:MAG: fluoride efflux transporter CrcB [Spirochaetaceae bacterium]|jgi:CrcB protein|nr:fluoride efflux transporter CrcB [Spirochaetaceae bacterium]
MSAGKDAIMKFVVLILGGGIGSLLRYISSQYFNTIFTAFQAGTLFVNTIGALLIGFLFNTFQTFAVQVELRLFLITGFLGGFTTFSTYSLETVQYLLNGNIKLGILNILLNNVLCIVFVIAGIWISKIIISR